MSERLPTLVPSGSRRIRMLRTVDSVRVGGRFIFHVGEVYDVSADKAMSWVVGGMASFKLLPQTLPPVTTADDDVEVEGAPSKRGRKSSRSPRDKMARRRTTK